MGLRLLRGRAKTKKMKDAGKWYSAQADAITFASDLVEAHRNFESLERELRSKLKKKNGIRIQTHTVEPVD